MAQQVDYNQYGGTSSYEQPVKNTLWMGELEPWMDEAYLGRLWWSLGEQVSCRIGMDRYGTRYAFIDFATPEGAAKALSLNGTTIPDTQNLFKLNWSNPQGSHSRSSGYENEIEYCLFCGDLSYDVTDSILLEAFRAKFPSCKSAKVMMDSVAGYSRGYGFIRFYDEADQQRALVEMQGALVENRPIRLSIATSRSRAGPTGGNDYAPYSAIGRGPDRDYGADSNSTTVFVGGLNSNVTEDDLRTYFAPYGNVVYIKIPPGKGCGFVQFDLRQSADLAIQELNGFNIAGSRLRLSFGRSQQDKHMHRPAYNADPYTESAQPYPIHPTPQQYMPPPPPAPFVVPAPPKLVDPRKPISVQEMNATYMDSIEAFQRSVETFDDAESVYIQS